MQNNCVWLIPLPYNPYFHPLALQIFPSLISGPMSRAEEQGVGDQMERPARADATC